MFMSHTWCSPHVGDRDDGVVEADRLGGAVGHLDDQAQAGTGNLARRHCVILDGLDRHDLRGDTGAEVRDRHSGTGAFTVTVTARTVWWMLPRTGGGTGVVAGWARGTRLLAAGADPDAQRARQRRMTVHYA